MDQMNPTTPVPPSQIPSVPTPAPAPMPTPKPMTPPPPQTVKTPVSSSSLAWIIGGTIVVLAAVAAGVWWWMSRAGQETAPAPTINPVGALPTAEVTPTAAGEALTPGNSVQEIEQDLNTIQLPDLESDIQAIEQDANQVP